MDYNDQPAIEVRNSGSFCSIHTDILFDIQTALPTLKLQRGLLTKEIYHERPVKGTHKFLQPRPV